MIGRALGILGVLVVAGCQASPPPVWYSGLKKPRYTRANLRSSSGVYLRSANLLSHAELVPPGTPAEIIEYGEMQVDLRIHQTKYTMVPVGGTFDATEEGARTFVEKYFVDDPTDADPESLGPTELTSEVRRGEVVQGMTKEQVYCSLGPPQWIAEEELPTVRLSRKRILESDVWVYTEDVYLRLVPRKVYHRFRDGKLTHETEG